MFISKDFKNLFISNPRTGTQSIRIGFRPYVYYIHDPFSFDVGNHLTISQCIRILENQQPNFKAEQIEKIFTFWRDPVERFISAVNYLKNPMTYGAIIDIKNGTPNSKLKEYIPDSLSIDAITPEYVLQNILPALDELDNSGEVLVHFSKQSKWIVPNEKFEVLDFANYESNFRYLGGFFGVDSNKEIPREHQSIGGYTSLEPATEVAVRQFYAEDYALI